MHTNGTRPGCTAAYFGVTEADTAFHATQGTYKIVYYAKGNVYCAMIRIQLIEQMRLRNMPLADAPMLSGLSIGRAASDLIEQG